MDLGDQRTDGVLERVDAARLGQEEDQIIAVDSWASGGLRDGEERFGEIEPFPSPDVSTLFVIVDDRQADAFPAVGDDGVILREMVT